ncbi:MAG: PEP-CTERM sorting domain-containing protein [Phycisphaerae bacterium]|nr:PEP-CTERM sorting domain-containing protein [Phycisphaerae bacterium]
MAKEEKDRRGPRQTPKTRHFPPIAGTGRPTFPGSHVDTWGDNPNNLIYAFGPGGFTGAGCIGLGTPVPEPATLSLLALGDLAILRRRFVRS